MATTASTKLRYPAEVVGSLLRPEYLKRSFEAFERGDITEDELGAAQDRAALEAIRLQEECGLDVLTDGEVRRRFWFDPLTASLGYNYEESAPVPFTGGGGRPEEAPPKLAAEGLRSYLVVPLVAAARWSGPWPRVRAGMRRSLWGRWPPPVGWRLSSP
jgi:hypothetical protein